MNHRSLRQFVTLTHHSRLTLFLSLFTPVGDRSGALRDPPPTGPVTLTLFIHSRNGSVSLSLRSFATESRRE